MASTAYPILHMKSEGNYPSVFPSFELLEKVYILLTFLAICLDSQVYYVQKLLRTF